MYSSRRKSKQSYRKRVASRKNKTRSKRKNLKFRKMRGGAMTYEEFKTKLKTLQKTIDTNDEMFQPSDFAEAEMKTLYKDNEEFTKKIQQEREDEQKQNEKKKQDIRTQNEKDKQQRFNEAVEAENKRKQDLAASNSTGIHRLIDRGD